MADVWEKFRVSYGKWERWFAWRPVLVSFRKEFRWLCSVERRTWRGNEGFGFSYRECVKKKWYNNE